EEKKGSFVTSVATKGKHLVLQHVPIISWLPKYTKFDAVSDAVAGFTVGLTLMPQSIAYASLAGLSAQYGLYTAFMGSLVYTFFGTIKEVSIGPTSLMALLTFQFTEHLGVEFVILLSFLAGCVELLMGVLNAGQIKPGLPAFQLPPFSAQIGNVTYSFPEMCKELGSGIILIPIVAVLANVAIAKAFSTIILLALSFLTPYFYFIPRATLSAVLICAVMFMIEWEKALLLWRTSKRDFLLLLLTFLSCLLMGVEVGLLMGVAADIVYLLYLWARPNIDVEICKSPVGGEYLIVTPDIGLPYAAVDFLRTEVCRVGEIQGAGILPLAINFKNVKSFDFTTSMGIDSLLKDFEKRGQPLIFLNMKPQDVEMIHNANVKMMQYCHSEEELEDLLFGEKLDLGRCETMPILGSPCQDKSLFSDDDFNSKKENESDLELKHEEKINISS
ncbi:Uncharacterized protein GBIM_01501, partial [Gryllus bimaculatus]